MIEHLNREGLVELVADLKGYSLDKANKAAASAASAEANASTAVAKATEAAASAATAVAGNEEWNNTYKPEVIADHNTAVSDHTQASSDHSTAVSDHNQASIDHATAQVDHAQAIIDLKSAVLVTPNQGLTEEQQKNARANIGLGDYPDYTTLMSTIQSMIDTSGAYFVASNS